MGAFLLNLLGICLNENNSKNIENDQLGQFTYRTLGFNGKKIIYK